VPSLPRARGQDRRLAAPLQALGLIPILSSCPQTPFSPPDPAFAPGAALLAGTGAAFRPVPTRLRATAGAPEPPPPNPPSHPASPLHEAAARARDLQAAALAAAAAARPRPPMHALAATASATLAAASGADAAAAAAEGAYTSEEAAELAALLGAAAAAEAGGAGGRAWDPAFSAFSLRPPGLRAGLSAAQAAQQASAELWRSSLAAGMGLPFGGAGPPGAGAGAGGGGGGGGGG